MQALQLLLLLMLQGTVLHVLRLEGRHLPAFRTPALGSTLDTGTAVAVAVNEPATVVTLEVAAGGGGRHISLVSAVSEFDFD